MKYVGILKDCKVESIFDFQSNHDIEFRERLFFVLYRKYSKRQKWYSLSNMETSNRISSSIICWIQSIVSLVITLKNIIGLFLATLLMNTLTTTIVEISIWGYIVHLENSIMLHLITLLKLLGGKKDHGVILKFLLESSFGIKPKVLKKYPSMLQVHAAINVVLRRRQKQLVSRFHYIR